MPLSESEREVIVDYIKNIDFTYGDYDPQVKVYRYGEGFPIQHPYILVKFLPSNRAKFKSISDLIEPYNDRYNEFGFCHMENMSIHVYCADVHYNTTAKIKGRLLCAYISQTCLDNLFRNIDRILLPYGASFDISDTIPTIRDMSYFDQETETMIYNYDFDFMLRTHMRYNFKPDYYDESEDYIETLYMEVDPNEDENNKIIIKIKES